MLFLNGNLNRRRGQQTGRIAQSSEPCEVRSLLSADPLVSELVEAEAEATVCDEQIPGSDEMLAVTCDLNYTFDAELTIPEEWMRLEIPPGELESVVMIESEFATPEETSFEWFEDAPPLEGWDPSWAYRTLIAFSEPGFEGEGYTVEDFNPENLNSDDMKPGDFENVYLSFLESIELPPDSMVIYGDDGSISEIIPLYHEADFGVTTFLADGSELIDETVTDELKREVTVEDGEVVTEVEESVELFEDIPPELLMLMSMMTMVPDAPAAEAPALPEMDLTGDQGLVLSTPSRAALNQQPVLFQQRVLRGAPIETALGSSVVASTLDDSSESQPAASNSNAPVYSGLTTSTVKNRTNSPVRLQLNRLRIEADGVQSQLFSQHNETEHPATPETVVEDELPVVDPGTQGAPGSNPS